MIFLLYLLIIFSYEVIKFLLKNKLGFDEIIVSGAGYLYLYLFLLPILLITNKSESTPKKKKLCLRNIFIIFCQQTILSIVAMNIGRLILEHIGNFEAQNGLSISSYNLLILLIIAPIFEELFFRKSFIDKCMGDGQNRWLIILLSAIAFAIPHLFSQGILQVLYALVLGIIWGTVYIRYNNIFYSMLLHFLSNLFMISISVIDNIIINSVVIFGILLINIVVGLAHCKIMEK